MPFMLFDELPADKTIIAVVSVDYEKNFLDKASGNWKIIGEVPKGALEAFAEKFFYGKEQLKLKSKIYRRESK